MTTYIALLRGINVGGHKRIGMKDLQALVAGLGHSDVSTYIQSGNVILRSEGTAADVARGIEDEIEREMGMEVRVVVRSREELGRVIEKNPFLPQADAARLYVAFLDVKPAADVLAALTLPEGPGEEHRIVGREVYLHFPEGYGRTKLTNDLWEQKLSVVATTRNWNTILTLHRLTSSMPSRP